MRTMSLSPEPVDIDTPPDSPSHWASDSSESTHELKTQGASPVKRVRKPSGRQTSKRIRASKHEEVTIAHDSSFEGAEEVVLERPRENVSRM